MSIRDLSGRSRASTRIVEKNELAEGDIVLGDKYVLPIEPNPLVVDDPNLPEVTLENDSNLARKLVGNAGFDTDFLNYARTRRLRAYKKTLELEALQMGHWIVNRLKRELETIYMTHCHIPILSGSLGREVYPKLDERLDQIVRAFPFDEFEEVSFDAEYLRGLVFETTAECRLRWARCQ